MPRKIPVRSTRKKKYHFSEVIENGSEFEEVKYKLRLPSKSGSTSFPDVLRIAKRNTHWIEGQVQFITFDELTEDFQELLDICTMWKVTRLYIDGEEHKKQDILSIRQILYCGNEDKCKGACTRSPLTGYQSVGELIRFIVNDHIWHLEHLSAKQLLIKETDDIGKYSVNHDKLLGEIKENYKFEEE